MQWILRFFIDCLLLVGTFVCIISAVLAFPAADMAVLMGGAQGWNIAIHSVGGVWITGSVMYGLAMLVKRPRIWWPYLLIWGVASLPMGLLVFRSYLSLLQA